MTELEHCVSNIESNVEEPILEGTIMDYVDIFRQSSNSITSMSIGNSDEELEEGTTSPYPSNTPDLLSPMLNNNEYETHICAKQYENLWKADDQENLNIRPNTINDLIKYINFINIPQELCNEINK